MPAHHITFSQLSWTTPDGRTLFSNLDLAFGLVHTGLVGRNGVGKSTLLHLASGAMAPQAGTVSVSGTIGVLEQTVAPEPGATIADLFGVADSLDLLARAEAGTATGDDLADADWTLQARLEAALGQFGLSVEPDTPLSRLSGGQATRAKLAALVFAEPDFIVLDEPTNNMDRDGREGVLGLLSGWRGGAVVVSHDRELLETMDMIVELTSLGATSYGGGWSLYRERKAIELAAAEHESETARRRLAEIDRKTQIAAERKARKNAAGRRDKAKGGAPKIVLNARASAAENSGGADTRTASRMREDATRKVQSAREKIEVLQPLSVALPPTGLVGGRKVLTLEAVTAGYANADPVITDFSLSIVGPERIAPTGPNGSGKSTLLKLIAGELIPQGGTVQCHVPLAMLDQKVGLLDPRLSIRDNFRRLNPGAGENQCRSALARFLFRADAALQRVETLSGGQILRAGLACVLGAAEPPQLLILDEPTNHLDIASIEAVEAGLNGYDGALLVVSHDRTFLDAIGITREIELD